MELGPLIVLLLRLIIPLAIFRWPLAAGIFVVFLDGSDVILMDVIKRGFWENYSAWDKFLDQYYLTIELIVSLRWTNQLAKKTSIFLYVYRLIGVVVFEVLTFLGFTDIRYLFFIFPNLFENFFLFYLAFKKLFPKREIGWRGIVISLLILLIPKMIQEYLLHMALFNPWHWFKTNIWWFK